MGLSGGFGLGARAVGSADLGTAASGRFGIFGVLCAVMSILRAGWIVCVILLGTLMLDRGTP